MLYNKGNHAKLKYVQLQPSPSRVKMVAKFIRRGIRVILTWKSGKMKLILGLIGVSDPTNKL
jgi:hypothetical protein